MKLNFNINDNLSLNELNKASLGLNDITDTDLFNSII